MELVCSIPNLSNLMKKEEGTWCHQKKKIKIKKKKKKMMRAYIWGWISRFAQVYTERF